MALNFLKIPEVIELLTKDSRISVKTEICVEVCGRKVMPSVNFGIIEHFERSSMGAMGMSMGIRSLLRFMGIVGVDMRRCRGSRGRCFRRGSDGRTDVDRSHSVIYSW